MPSRLEDRIAAEYRDRSARLSNTIQADLKAGKISKKDIPAILSGFERSFSVQANARRTQLAQAALNQEGEGAVASGVNTAFQAVRGAGDTAFFGAPSALGARAASLVQGRPLDEVQIEQEAKAANAPRAGLMGSVAGAFMGGPRALGNAATNLTGRAFLKPTLAAAEAGGFSGTVGKIALEGLRGATAGAGTAVPTAAIEGLIAGKSREQITGDLWFPLVAGAGLGAAGGTVAGLARTPEIDQAGVQLLDRMKRIAPGFRADAAFLRQYGGVQSLLATAANSPIGKSKVRRFYESGYLQPARAAIADLRNQISGGKTNPGAAAAAVRKAVGPAGQESGALQREISGIQRPAFATEGGNTIPLDRQEVLLRGLANMDRVRRETLMSRGIRGEALSGLMGEVRNLGAVARRAAAERAAPKLRAGGRQGQYPQNSPEGRRVAADAVTESRITVEVYENLKQRARAIAQFDAQANAGGAFSGYSRADVQEARRLYAMLNQAERETSPLVDRAMLATRPLRQLQAELRPLVPAARGADDAHLLQQVFTGKNPSRRMEVLHRVMPPQDAKSIAGTYFADFLEEVTKRAGGFNGPKAQELWRASSGKYRAEMFDAVVGSGSKETGRKFREILSDILDSTDRAARSVGAVEGSPTAGRLLSAAVVLNTVELANDIFTDPRVMYHWARQAGGAAFAVAALNSTLDGKLANQLNKLATGQAAGAITQTPVALDEARKNIR